MAEKVSEITKRRLFYTFSDLVGDDDDDDDDDDYILLNFWTPTKE